MYIAQYPQTENYFIDFYFSIQVQRTGIVILALLNIALSNHFSQNKKYNSFSNQGNISYMYQ